MLTKEEVKKNLYKSLKELNLSDPEINLYTASLALGPTTINNLAKHLHMQRPNVYKLIEGLEKVGLAKFTEKKKYSRNFVVESPSVILDKLRKKKEQYSRMDNDLVTIMPDLLTQYHQGASPTKIKVIQGEKQYINTYNQALDEENEVIKNFGKIITLVPSETSKKFDRKRKNKNIYIKNLILSDDENLKYIKTDKKNLIKTKIIEDMASFITNFQIIGKKVIILQPKTSLGIVIEDEYIVNMLESIFDYLWHINKNFYS